MTREYDLYLDDDDDDGVPPPPPPPTLEVLTQTTCMKFVIRYLDGCSRRRLASTSTFYWRWYKNGFETGQLPKLTEDGRVQQHQKIRKVKLAEQPKNAPQTELAEVDLVRSSSMASQKSATGKFSRGPSSLFKPLSSSSSGKKPISAIKRVFVKRSPSKTSSSSNHVNEMEASTPIAPSTSVQSTQHHKQSSEHNVVRIPSSSVKSLENHGQLPEANAIESPVTIASSQQPQLGQPHTKTVSHLSDSQKASLSSVDTNSSIHAHPPKNKHNHENETNMVKREECNHTGNTQMMRKLPSLLGFSHSRSFEENDEEPFDQMEPALIRNLSSTTAANVAHPSKAPNREAVSSSQPSKPALILGSPTRGSSFDTGIGAGSPPRLSLSHDTRNKSLRDDHGKEWFHRHHNDEVEGDDTTTPSESESESTSFSSRPSLLLGANGRPKSKPASMTPVVVTPPRSYRAGLGNSNGDRDSVSFGIDRVGSRDGSRSRSRSRSRNGYRNGNQYLFRDDDSPSDHSEQEEEVEDDLSRDDRYPRHQREHGRQSEQRELRHVQERRHSREPTTRRETAIQPDQNTRPSDTPDMLQQLADAALFNAPLILTEAPVVFSNYMNGLIEKTRVPQKGNGLNSSAVVDGGVARAGIDGFATNGNSRGHESVDGKESNNNERDNGRNHSNKENKRVVTKPTLKEAVPNRRNSEALTEIEKVESTPKESRTKKALPRGNQAATPDFIQQLTDAALFEAPTVVSKYINGIFGLAGDKDSNENIEEEEEEEETIDSLILKGFQNYGEHDPVSSEVTLEEMIFSGFTRGLNVVPRMEITEVMTEEDIDEKIMSGLVKGKIIDLAVEKYYSQNDGANVNNNENQDVDDQGPIQIGNKLYTHEEARQIWLRARKRSGDVASEESIPKEKETLKEAILAQLIAERLREYKRVNEEKYGSLGFDGSTEKELEDGGDAGSYKYGFGLRRRRFFDESGMRRSLSPIEGRYGDGDVEGNGYANRAGVGNDDGYDKKLFTDTNKNAKSVNNNSIANNSVNINGFTNARGDGFSSGGYYSNKTGARKSSVRFKEEEAPVPNANDASTPRQTNNKKSPTGPVSLDRLITDFENKKDATKYDDETTEVANNARRHIAMNSVSTDIPTKKLFREVTESEDVSAKDTTVYNSLSTFRQRQEAIIEEIIRKTYAEETPKIENKTLPCPPMSFIEEANTTATQSSPAKDSVLGSNYGVEVTSIHGTNPKFVNNSKIGVTTIGGESFLGSQFGTEVVVKPEKLVTERKPRTLASHNMNVRGSLSNLSVKGFGGIRQNVEGGKKKGAEAMEKSALPPPISEVKVKTRKTNPLKKLGIKKPSKS